MAGMIHDMYLFEVKKPGAVQGPWDYYKFVRTIPADQAFRREDGRLPAGEVAVRYGGGFKCRPQ